MASPEKNSRDVELVTKEYDVTDTLGSGRFGSVHLATRKSDGAKFAAKICICRPSQKKEIAMEIEIMKELDHPKLVALSESFVGRREAVLIIELVTGGELFQRIVDESFALTEQLAVKYLKQICEGVSYLHAKNILHLDMKPENILCVAPDKLDEVKIIDFGFARRYTPNTPLKVMFGTPEFVAPEIVNFDPLGPGTDMWSIGVMTYTMLSGLSPFMGDTDQETLSNVTACEWDFEDDSFNDISVEAKGFVEKLLTPRESERLTSDKCLQHPWLTEDPPNEKLSQKKNLGTAVENMKKFVSRRKWMRSINAVRAINRFQVGVKKGVEKSPERKRSPAAAARTRELLGK